MDQARRNFLVYQIISGIKYITIDGYRYKLITPSLELRLLSEHIYQDTMNDLRFSNLITRNKATLLLRALDIWHPKDDKALKDLEKFLDSKKIALYTTLYDRQQQEKNRKAIKTAKKSINQAYVKKYSLDHMTLEYHAFLTQKKFLIAMCLQDRSGASIYNEDTYNTADAYILEKVINCLDNDIISIEEFRELARHDPWRTMWNLGKESCIVNTASEWSEDQKHLMTYAKMYDNAYQSMECPPDDIFEDDDAFDGWLLKQRQDREKEQKQKQVDTLENIPDSAQEVFVFAPTREDANKVYDLNDLEGRMKIKQRAAYIEKHGVVQAQDLPDTKLELQRQQIDEYKNRISKG
tara:strand:- start:543 stop:1595 length:1053 start_codon:yes stop_codon:yes gene_type:complete